MNANEPARYGQPAPDALQRLWAPWRATYVQAAEPIHGCPFCVLPQQPVANDEAGLILHRGEHAYVMMNAYPYNPGHLMVLPYAHEADLVLLDDDTATELFTLTRQSVGVLTETLNCDGVNLGMNLGSAAGAGIPDHVHMHAVPRWDGDTNFLTVAADARVLPRSMTAMYHELAAGFNT